MMQQKTIGLIGGMSWESTMPYYQAINRRIAARLGGLHSAKIILISVDFAEIEQLQHAGQWQQAGRLLAEAAQRLEKAGADFFLLCTNTMHIVAEQVQAAVRIPLLHIADATVQEVKQAGIHRIGLLGTKFTMEQSFYRDRLTALGLDVMVPNEADRMLVHRVIYDELCKGVTLGESRNQFVRVISQMGALGAHGVILGCTEISMLVQSASVPLFDTAAIHASAAADFALRP
jgi:aspartate racemase